MIQKDSDVEEYIMNTRQPIQSQPYICSLIEHEILCERKK